MATNRLKFGTVKQASKPTKTFTWPIASDETPDDISGFTVTGTMYEVSDDGATTAISGTLSVTDGAARTCTWAMSAGDTGTAGIFKVTFYATDGADAIYTLYGDLEIEDNPSVTGTQNDPLVSIPVVDAAWLTTQTANGEDVGDKQSKDTDAVADNAAKMNADGEAVDAGFAFGTAAANDTGDFVAVTGDTMSGTLKVGANAQVEGASVLVSFPVDSTLSGGAGWHGLRDESEIALTAATINNAYAAVDLAPKIIGTSGYDHLRGVQIRLDHAGTGTVSAVRHITIQDVGGVGAVTANTALYIDAMTRGDTNWAIETNSPSRFGSNNAFGTSSLQPAYPVHVRGDADTSFNGVVIQNTSTGTAAISSLIIGEDISTKYASFNVFGTNYISAVNRNQMVFLAANGLVNGINFQTVGAAPIKMTVSNTITALTIDGTTGAATANIMLSSPRVEVTTPLYAETEAIHIEVSGQTTGWGNYIEWGRPAEPWHAARIGQLWSGVDFSSSLVLGVHNGTVITEQMRISKSHVTIAAGLNAAGLPTSASGLSVGDVWNNAGVLNVVI